MTTAKIFENGRSQAVRFPKEYRFEEDEVNINKIGDFVILMSKGSKWDCFMDAINMFSEDFIKDGRNEILKQD